MAKKEKGEREGKRALLLTFFLGAAFFLGDLAGEALRERFPSSFLSDILSLFFGFEIEKKQNTKTPKNDALIRDVYWALLIPY